MANLDRLDCDFYSIEENSNGNKRVHVFGYVYRSDCGDPDDGDKVYRNVVNTFFYIPIESFPDNYQDVYNQNENRCTAYIEDITKAQAIEIMERYFGDEPITELDYSDITLETPCGNYVNKNPGLT